jgi:hypothetical protein
MAAFIAGLIAKLPRRMLRDAPCRPPPRAPDKLAWWRDETGGGGGGGRAAEAAASLPADVLEYALEYADWWAATQQRHELTVQQFRTAACWRTLQKELARCTLPLPAAARRRAAGPPF